MNIIMLLHNTTNYNAPGNLTFRKKTRIVQLNHIFMKLLKAFIALFIFCLSINAQIDNRFWFAMPDITDGSDASFTPNNGQPINLHITALYETTVTISRPADPSFTPFVIHLSDMEHYKKNLLELLSIDNIETYASNNLANVSNKGFLIESSPSEIAVYCEWDNNSNREIMPLKGRNALGTDFWVSTQNRWPNYDLNITPHSGFVILATEDNTTVTVTRNSDFLYYTTPPPETLILNLDKGETFMFQSASLVADHINGVSVNSTKDIVITAYDDGIDNDNGCGIDMTVDQIVPDNIAGREYFIKKGLMDSDEFLMITALANGTSIDYNGTNITPIPMNAGDVKRVELLTDTAYIVSTAAISVSQYTGIRCEMASAVLPSAESCIGSHVVPYTRGSNPLDVMHMRIIARNDAGNQTINNFFLISNTDTFNIPAGYFAFDQANRYVYLRDGTDVQTYFSQQIPLGSSVRIHNPVSRFQFGVLSGNKTTGAKYGFFSEYSASTVSAGIGGFTHTRDTSKCGLEPLRFVGWGGESYTWTGVSDPNITDLLSNNSIADPVFDPDTGGTYIFNVEIQGTCIGTQNIQIEANVYPTPESNFYLDSYAVCSRDLLTVNNISDTTYSEKQLWNIEPAGLVLNQDTLDRTFTIQIPDNLSDSIQKYTITLNSYSPGDYCVNPQSQTFNVKPHVTVDFTPSVDIGCSPLKVSFDKFVSSGSDTLYYRWDFGNGSQSNDTAPNITYTNLGVSSATHNAELVVETTFGCTDTATHLITVHPRVESAFGLDSNLSCSPLVATLDPGASVNADSLFWYIDYFYGDSTHFTDTTLPLTITHYDTSIYAGPDTLEVYLVVKNAEGCVDTSAKPQLFVYPNIVADFDIDKNEICDNDSILFTNLSDGYEPRFEWDFGNSSYAQDSSLNSYRKTYFNRSDRDTIYTVSLTAISGNFCSDTKDTVITVHPYVKADFGFEYLNNCSPLNATISNTSIGADSLNIWDLGDGTPVADNPILSYPHTYENSSTDTDTTYYIKLLTVNKSGCKDSLERTLTLLPEVISNFSIVDTSICSHNNISFTNTSTGNNLTYLWSFGDGQSSTNSSVAFTKYYENNYKADTNYTISLIARNAIGCADTSYRYVEVLANIYAFFSLPNADSCSPFTIRPQNLSSESSNTFWWDFDISTSNLENPVIPPYTNVGMDVDSITIVLATAGADDAKHWACSDTHRIPIQIYPELRVSFDLDTSVSCQPLIAAFTNTTVPTDGTTYAWYHNNYYYSNQYIPNDITIYNNTSTDSTHTIWLYGESKYGCRGTANHTAEVYALIDAGFTLNRIGICPYDSVYIDRTSSRGDIAIVTWDFNGTILPYTDVQFSHSFDNHANSVPENRVIKLTLENSHGCVDSTSENILVYPTVTAGYTVDSLEACYGHTTEFTNNSVNSTYWLWTFGDGLSSTEKNPFHFYNNHSTILDSIYNIELIAGSEYDCYDTTTGNVTVWARPKAEFYFPVTIDCPPFTVDMVNNSTGSDPKYLWRYADTTSTYFNTSFEFNNYGTEIEEQKISLTVTSDNGCVDSTVNTIGVYPNLHANIVTENDTVGCSPLNVSFGIENNTNIQQIVWYVDDKAFSSIKDPNYRFTNPDPGNNTYNVMLVARSVNNCVDTSWMPITVYPTPEIVFGAGPIPADYDFTVDRTTISFTNSTIHQGNWLYEWDFGDGTTNQLNEGAATFDHIYGDHFWGDKNDDFRVPIKLTTWNPDNPLCSDTDSLNIIINPPVPQVNIHEDVSGCQPLFVDFSATTKYIYQDSYRWEFGDKVATSEEEAPSFTYTEAGKYHVTLTVEGDYGVMSDYKIIEVYPKPIVDFTFNDTVVSIDIDTINFYNHSSNAVEYYWYFNSEDIFSGNYNSIEENPKWVYTTPGAPTPYYPALIAMSTEDCYDTLIHPTGILVYEVGLIEFPNAFLAIPGQPAEEYATDQVEGGNRYLFYPKHESVEKYHIEIYNKWGTKIFESNDINRGWNGLIDGVMGKQDVYVFRAQGRFINGQAFDVSGDITLLHTKPGAN